MYKNLQKEHRVCLEKVHKLPSGSSKPYFNMNDLYPKNN